ncbi:uncharacterized protein LOC111016835 isoform X2 [Momordica charantia]|uniref:Uncharacterized protein LOC111016835 isoform X2 n=1 Tax=Momordica charantia TaxID=3673 RepID=A0A6J1D2X6_MOMCH|nr:uncharacterized protein LOC111016835 isoform X2 [Momordica charantia]
MNSAAAAGRRLFEGVGDGRFCINTEKWKLFLVVVAALLASLAFKSNASETIGEWQILTKHNFSSQIRLHPHILLLVTLPWSGESRALMRDIAHLIENKKESYSSLKLMFMYRNTEKMLVHAIGATSEETNVIFYHHSVSYKYQGRLTAQNIVFSIYPSMSLLPEELPFTLLNTPEDLKSFLDSTDRALLLMEFCGWTPKLLSKGIKSNFTDDLLGTTDECDRIQTSRGKNNSKSWNKNTDMMCSIEKGYDGVPWLGEFSSGNETSFTETKSTNHSFPSSCNIEDFERYNSFFTNLLAVARELFLPREKHGFGLISNRLMLSSLGIEDSDSWFAALRFAGCPRCSKILREGDDLKQNLQMNNFIVSELEVDGSSQQPALPVNKPSIILFVDRSSNSSESRRESKVALGDFRELAQQYCTSYPITEPLLQKYPIMRGTLEPPRLKLSPASRLIKLEDKMSAVMIVNEGKLVTLDKLTSELQGNSLPQILSLLQKKEAKLSSLARNLGFQLLSDDIDVKLASSSPEVTEVQPFEVSPEISQEGPVIHSVQLDEDQSNNGRCVSAKEHMEASEFCTVESSPLQDNEKRTSIHTVEDHDFIQSDESAPHQKLDVAQNIKVEEKSSLTMETSLDENLHFQGFEGSFFFSDGNYRLLKALTGQSKSPALVIVDPLLQQHYVFPVEKTLSYSSQADFLSSFLNRSLLPYQHSESVIKSPRAAVSPPFLNLDFHEVDSVPRVTALTFSKLVIGFNQSESINEFNAYSKDVLVLFSNSWCGFCQRTEVVVREVYRAIQGSVNILKSGCGKEKKMLSETQTDLLSKLPLIYLMDCTLNDCSSILKSIDQREVYPALLLFPAERKKAIVYEGDLAVNDIIKFVAEQGSNSQHLINQKGILWTVGENRIEPTKSFEDAGPTHLQEKDAILNEKYHEVLMTDRKVESATRFSHINLHIANGEDDFAPPITVGSILIATDKLVGSQPFANSQILIVKADQTIGFHGLITNKHIRWDSLQDLAEGLDVLNEAPLSLGGPLIKRKTPLLALTQRVSKDLHFEVLPGIYFLDQVATVQEIEEIKLGNHSVTGYWFFLGYSSWGWDQLYDEIAEGAWRLSDDSTSYLEWPEV